MIGAVTALFAATVGLTQNDIKRVIAYSTCSQLGYMFFAAGVGAYQAAMFHLFTHAFFKALLFLGAGSVIHGMHHEQDMRKMGVVRSRVVKSLAWTSNSIVVGSVVEAVRSLFAKVEVAISGLDWSGSGGAAPESGQGFSIDPAGVRAQTTVLRTHAATMRAHGDDFMAAVGRLGF